MKYDPIKSSLGKVFNKTPFLRRMFYRMLDVLLLRTWHVKKALKAWAKNNKEDIHVLDAGSGFGQYTYFMASKFPEWKILAVDVKDDQIEDCNSFFNKIGLDNARFEIADLTRYTSEESFNLILSVDVMEHIEDDVQVFRNFHKSLKPGGTVIISTPSDQGGSDVHHHHHEEYENDGTMSFIDEHVRDGYNIQGIQDKLSAAGFTRTFAAYQYGKPGKISWRLSMKYPIQMLNVSKIFFIILPFYYLISFPFCLILNWLDIKLKHKTGTGLIVKAWK